MGQEAANGLSEPELRDLRRVAGLMIPPSAEFGVPGADDPVIFDDIVRSLGRDLGAVRAALEYLRLMAGRAFAEVEVAQAEILAARFQALTHPAIVALGRAILQCYYRDDRVVLSLGLEPRPPFPKGRSIEQGDWSLLDPVRMRAPMWREA